ncbi:DNA starvation/stationary phase protection protein Dps [Salipiger sp. IMCC34102]|uniref:DNA starvation/stationary phase protection protein Dps n=1 Tax=Salipiger sp. IMCC34102 TaxID=2510647 RepID=UPI00101DB384|nr:DNA starvation/stationary phase protection protein Dps [Salipiger sp. IMCC34102]RYH04293.1 DNA starvation/stationary phase protection protein Dps [Salipiger sp. IMCC34102]
MPEAFVAGLDGQTREKVINILNDNLVEMQALQMAVKQAHWNLKGDGFIGVHELLDGVSARLLKGIDTIAERTVILGGYARGTLEVAADRAKMKAYPVELTDLDAHVVELQERFLSVGASIRQGASDADEAGDADTEDLFVEISRALDKDAWFIGANAKK